MDFSPYQVEGARTLRRLRFAYLFALVGVVLVLNAVALLGWRLLFAHAPLPYAFLLINTLASGGLMVAGTLIERQRLSRDSSSIAARLKARLLDGGASSLSLLERRVINVVEEMALAARQPIPRLYAVEHEPSINAMVIAPTREDAAVILTRGAIERLNRDELQGVIAHEIARLASGAAAVDSQLAAMNHGLELVADAGRRTLDAAVPLGPLGTRSPRTSLGLVLVVPGVVLLAAGWTGHLAARLLTGTVGRRREFDADALAVRLTRHPRGLGNALRKVSWMEIHDPSSARLSRHACPVGLRHALFQSGRALAGRGSGWLATHPPLAERIERLMGAAAAPMVAERTADDETSLTLDWSRDAAWLALSALPALVHVPGTEVANHPVTRSSIAAAVAATGLRNDDLIALIAATHDSNTAAALTTLLVVGGAVQAEVWPLHLSAAGERQAEQAARLRRLGPATVEGLRYPLLELCAAAMKPLATSRKEDFLRMLRGQIEIDQRVTLAEWIYYMLLRARLLPADDGSWRGDESEVSTAEAVRWVMALLARCVGEPDLRAQRVSNEIIQDLGLSRTGQWHPPLDMGGLQAAVASLGQLPVLQRPLLVRRLVKFLPQEAPIESRDFVRVLALIIDCPMPDFFPVMLLSAEAQSMLTDSRVPLAQKSLTVLPAG